MKSAKEWLEQFEFHAQLGRYPKAVSINMIEAIQENAIESTIAATNKPKATDAKLRELCVWINSDAVIKTTAVYAILNKIDELIAAREAAVATDAKPLIRMLEPRRMEPPVIDIGIQNDESELHRMGGFEFADSVDQASQRLRSLFRQQLAPDLLPGGIIEYVPTEADKSLLAAAEAVANDAGQVHERHCGFSYRYHEVGTESIRALRAAVERAVASDAAGKEPPVNGPDRGS